MSILISFINALYCTTAVQTYWRSHKYGISQSPYCRLIDESVKNYQPDTFQTVDLAGEFESNASSELNELWVQNKIDSLNEINNNVQAVGTLEQSEETEYYYDLYDFGLEEVVTNPKIDNKRVKIECENVINDWSDNGILNDKRKLITPQNIKILNTNAPVVEDQKKITVETIPIEEHQAFGDEETTYLIQPEKGKRHGFFCAIIAFCKKVVNRFFRAKK